MESVNVLDGQKSGSGSLFKLDRSMVVYSECSMERLSQEIPSKVFSLFYFFPLNRTERKKVFMIGCL